MKTARLRICVTIDEHGHWCAHGWSRPADESTMWNLADDFDQYESARTSARLRRYVVEAEVPIDAPDSVKADISKWVPPPPKPRKPRPPKQPRKPAPKRRLIQGLPCRECSKRPRSDDHGDYCIRCAWKRSKALREPP